MTSAGKTILIVEDDQPVAMSCVLPPRPRTTR